MAISLSFSFFIFFFCLCLPTQNCRLSITLIYLYIYILESKSKEIPSHPFLIFSGSRLPPYFYSLFSSGFFHWLPLFSWFTSRVWNRDQLCWSVACSGCSDFCFFSDFEWESDLCSSIEIFRCLCVLWIRYGEQLTFSNSNVWISLNRQELGFFSVIVLEIWSEFFLMIVWHICLVW